MKKVLISINPKHCINILEGKKTTEIRKTCPKMSDNRPFLAYIYCTDDKKDKLYMSSGRKYYIENSTNSDDILLNRKIIGKFICHNVSVFHVLENNIIQNFHESGADKACVEHDFIANYIGKNHKGYAWKISDLHIYTIPKTIEEFAYELEEPIRVPPMSWRYVR